GACDLLGRRSLSLPPPLWGRAGEGGTECSATHERLSTPTPNPSPQGGGEPAVPVASHRLESKHYFCAPSSTFAHLSSIARASSFDSAESGGNRSFQANGLHASTISLECEVTPRAFASGAMRGSSAELQASRTMSTFSAGSQRVVTAHITSLRLDGSTSPSTTPASRPM